MAIQKTPSACQSISNQTTEHHNSIFNAIRLFYIWYTQGQQEGSVYKVQNVLLYSEENKYFNTLWFCKFSHQEIKEGFEIFILVACPLWET